MPRNVARLLAESTRQHVAVVGRLLFGIERVDSSQLAHYGWAELEGAAAVRQIDAQLEAEQEAFRARLSGSKAAAQIEAEQAQAFERLRELGRSRWKAMIGRPEGAEALRRRCDAYVCAAVARMGHLLPGAAVPEGVLPDGADLATIAVDLRDEAEVAAGVAPIYLAPTRFVIKQAEEDLDKGVVWVHSLSPDQRGALGLIIMGVQEGGADLACFRGEPGALRGDLADRDRDGALAPRGAGADALADGVHDPMPASRGGRNRSERRAARAGLPDDQRRRVK
jgi:hypothetical protein